MRGSRRRTPRVRHPTWRWSISHRRGALEGAQQQAELMKTLVDGMSDGVVAANERGEFTLFNPAAERILGMGMVEGGSSERSRRYGLYRTDGTTPFPPDELPLARALRGEASDRVEMIVRNANIPDGAWLSVNGRPLKDREGRVTGGVLVFRDVTQVKEAQRQLLETNQRLRQHGRFMETVFDALSDGVVVADASGRVTASNRTARRMTGFPGGAAGDVEPSEWSSKFGTYFPDRVTPFPAEDLPLARAIRGESTDGVELFMRNPAAPDGVYISSSGRPMRDASGALSGGVVVFSDVTRRKQAQEALTQAFAQGRLEVIDTVLHNIGNAISSVAVGMDTIRREAGDNELLGRFVALADAVSKHEDDWIVWLRDDPQGRQVRRFPLALVEDFAGQHDRVMRTVSRVSDRVRYIVDLIRTQGSDGTVERKVVALRPAFMDAIRILEESLRRRKVAVTVDCSRAPHEIRVQESKFSQMLVNLIKNAMEAIDEQRAQGGGGEAPPFIRITACSRDDALVIEITDNGIGIDPADTERVFRAGYSSKQHGSGLGLHSAANFVIASGGRIEALHREYDNPDSRLNRFAWFTRARALHEIHHAHDGDFSRSINYSIGGPLVGALPDRVFSTLREASDVHRAASVVAAGGPGPSAHSDGDRSRSSGLGAGAGGGGS